MKRNLRKRIVCKNKTKKVRHWWYGPLCTIVNLENFYITPIGSLTLWLKLKTGKWHYVTIVKEGDNITSYVNGIKE